MKELKEETQETIYPPINKEKREKYAIKMKSEAVIARLGYLFSLLNIPTQLTRSTDTVYTFNPKKTSKKIFQNDWKLYDNEFLGDVKKIYNQQ